MSTGPAPEDYPRLPGPARFVKEVVADLDAGKSVIIVFPDATVESGVAEAILVDIAAEGARAEFCDESTEHFPTRVISTFGLDPVSERVFDEWDTIIGWDAWQGSWVLVPGWQHKDINEIVDRWPAQLKVCGLPAEDRPKLVIAVRLADLPRKQITHLDSSSVGVHWWWGVLDRLDTETRLTVVSDRRLNPIEAAAITELSGWDLACTDYLVESWDRTTAGLSAAIRNYQDSVTPPKCSTDNATRSPAKRGVAAPPPELERSWREGLVDRWGHSIRWAPNTLDGAAVTQRLWMAHNRILIPHVDEQRVDFERMIRAKATRYALSDLWRREDDIIEIGSLAWLVDSGRVDIGKEHRLRLQAFRDLRNDLAHRRPIADELMQTITGYLDYEW